MKSDLLGDCARGRTLVSCLREVSKEFCGIRPHRGPGELGSDGMGLSCEDSHIHTGAGLDLRSLVSSNAPPWQSPGAREQITG